MKEEPCKHVEGVDTGKRIRKNLLNIGVFIAEILILVLLGPWAVRFFLPLLVGWLIAQIANPLVRFLEQHLHIVRKHSSMGIIAGAILLIVWICYLIVTWTAGRVVFLLEHLPEYYRSLSAEMTVISDNLESLAGHLSPEAGQKIGELTGSLSTQIGTIVGSLGGVTMGVAGNAAGKIPSLLISFLFVLLFAYFFTAQSERVQDFIKIIVPEETRRQLQLIGKKMKFAVGGYFRAQFKIMFIVFVIPQARYFMYLSTTSLPALSPALMALNAVLAETLPSSSFIFHMIESLSSNIASFVILTRPVAEENTSKQPCLPQVHCGPLGSITV